MPRHSEILRRLLGQGPMTSRQLVEKTGLSQPTVSREITYLRDEVVRFGARPAIQYALRDNSRSFTSVPIFRVTDDGRICELGALIPVRSNGFVMIQADGLARHSDGLPWWMMDMRPQGYLGRAWALSHAAGLGLPENPEHWNDTEVLRALLAHGHDAIGNLLIGELARNQFVDMPAPSLTDRMMDYPALARAAASGEAPGSSAGGEQPKFCAYVDGRHVLVKFSAATESPVSERWRDLLLSEQLALSVLGVKSEVHDFFGQRFLEVPRFDRIGEMGRIGVFSLRSIEAEFVGGGPAPWPSLVARLADEGHVTTEAVSGAALLWAFGCLIGNTDMHTGNLSFISSHGRPYQLAPAYDMLPMAFAPRSSGEIVNTLKPASIASCVDSSIWRQALELAERFVELLRGAEFSASFAPCIEALVGHAEEAGRRIARLA